MPRHDDLTIHYALAELAACTDDPLAVLDDLFIGDELIIDLETAQYERDRASATLTLLNGAIGQTLTASTLTTPPPHPCGRHPPD